jgi:hypothetical protein
LEKIIKSVGMRTAKALLGVLSATVVSLLFFSSLVALAAPLTSNSYQFQETSLGGVGNSGATSTNYQSATSGGTVGNTNSTSAGFQINAGNTTTNDPTLAFSIISGSASFGSFSASTPATSTTTFQVADYTSYGYVVQVVGNAPTNGPHSLTTMSTTGPSQVGVEQFGINLVANTSPSSIGANPNHGQFGFGSAATNYSTTNNYRYVSGETIVTGPKSSGVTVYTISYIVNVAGLTPGGDYTGAQTLICTGTY